MIIPTIGMKGLIKFKEPFDKDEFKKKYEVIAIRDLIDYYNNNEDPLNNIYLRYGLTQEDYDNDIKAKVPIITLRTEGNKLTYVPANRILSLPQAYGVEYKQRVISVNLGMIPETISLNDIQVDIQDLVKDSLGIKPGVSVVETSSVCYKTEDEHKAFMSIFDRNPNVQNYKSYKTKYLQLVQDHNDMKNNYDMLQTFLASNAQSLIDDTSRPTPDELNVFTKKIKIEIASESMQKKTGLCDVLFNRYNKFNTTFRPAYTTSFSKVTSTSEEYYLMLDKSSGLLKLEEGMLRNQHFPNIFSSTFSVAFEPGITIITITLDEKTNIRSYKLRPWISEHVFCQKVRVSLINENGNNVNVRTYENGVDFNRSGTGVDSLVESGDLTLKESLNQEAPLPTPPDTI